MQVARGGQKSSETRGIGMSPKDIKVGETYVNRGKGKTTRTVLEIGSQHRPTRWLSQSSLPDEPGVLFRQPDARGETQDCLYLSSFAKWAGRKLTMC
jgi:hypothetical protein